jgi:nicotinic acid phosphoribosyltransferase
VKHLHIADTSRVRAVDVTDVYFLRTEKVLLAKGGSKHVCMEIFLKSYPDRALYETAQLRKDMPEREFLNL